MRKEHHVMLALKVLLIGKTLHRAHRNESMSTMQQTQRLAAVCDSVRLLLLLLWLWLLVWWRQQRLLQQWQLLLLVLWLLLLLWLWLLVWWQWLLVLWLLYRR